MQNGKGKYNMVRAKLQRALALLEEVEAEIRNMEAVWGGPLQKINLARYEHDPVMWNTVVRARCRYSYLLGERKAFEELVAALQRKLREVTE